MSNIWDRVQREFKEITEISGSANSAPVGEKKSNDKEEKKDGKPTK